MPDFTYFLGTSRQRRATFVLQTKTVGLCLPSWSRAGQDHFIGKQEVRLFCQSTEVRSWELTASGFPALFGSPLQGRMGKTVFGSAGFRQIVVPSFGQMRYDSWNLSVVGTLKMNRHCGGKLLATLIQLCCSVAPFCQFFLVAAPLKVVFPKKGSLFCQGH